MPRARTSSALQYRSMPSRLVAGSWVVCGALLCDQIFSCCPVRPLVTCAHTRPLLACVQVVILSPHGYFGQTNVLGMPDTGGQVGKRAVPPPL